MIRSPTDSRRAAQRLVRMLAYMFGRAHPHFLWNATGYRPTGFEGDWLDG